MRGCISTLSAIIISLHLFLSQAATVPDYAFTGDLSVTSITTADDITAIGEGAYAGSAIAYADIPAGVTDIGAYAFADCKSLTRVVIPEGVTVVSKGMFRGCTSLRDVSLPSTIETIDADAFASTAVERIDLSHCKNLRSMGERCFAECDRLYEIHLADGISHIGDAAFFGCTSLREILFPESLRHIGDCALACLTEVTTLTLPASLEYIGSNAMERMDRLSGIDAVWVKDVPRLGEDVWYGLDQHDIWLSVSPRLRDSFLSAPQWRDFNITGGTVSAVPLHAGSAEIKEVRTYRVSEIYITVTTYTDGSRRVEKILKTK